MESQMVINAMKKQKQQSLAKQDLEWQEGEQTVAFGIWHGVVRNTVI